MRAGIGIAAIATSVLASASTAVGAGAARDPRLGLSASPARVAVTGPAARAIVLRNPGSGPVMVDVTRARLGERSATGWLGVSPRRLTLPRHGTARLTVRIVPPRRAEPGNHRALVLLTTRPLRGREVGIRMRLGLVVAVRIPGLVVRHIVLGRLRVVRTDRIRSLAVALANRGNVTEELRKGRVTASIVRAGRLVARVRLHARDLAPGHRITATALLRTSLRGRVTAIVRVTGAAGNRPLVRRYRVSL